MQIWKSALFPFLYENYMSKILHEKNFYVLRYAPGRYVKSSFTNIQKQ